MNMGDAENASSMAAAKVRSLERVVLLTLAAVQFTSIVDFMVVIPLGPQLTESLGLSPAQFSLVVASYTCAAGITGLIASSLVDRFSRKRAFLGVYTGFLVGTLFCGLAPGYRTLVAARLGTGAFGGILGGMALAIIGDVFPDERRGSATGVLMSAFALASVVGVPFGLYLGMRFDWHVPFLLLAVLGCPILVVAARALPPLRDHVARSALVHPLRSLAETFTQPNHWNAFALVMTMMFGGFAVITNLNLYLVGNVGLSKFDLPWVYVTGGVLTLVSAPLIGRLADHYGKLRVYRVVAPVSAVLMLAVTNLPPVAPALAIAVAASLMMCNAGRMVAAMAMITGSVVSEKRGGFMSANSAIQHLSTGLGALAAGRLVVQPPGGRMQHFEIVGLIAVAATLVSLWLAGRVRPAPAGAALETETTATLSLSAAAEATYDAGEPIAKAGTL
jgi:predicted MFS family arabinose efflux permease